MLEVFYQVKDYAQIAIASEKDIPEHGWPYYDFLKPLTEDLSMSSRELSESIVSEYVHSYESGFVEDDDISVALTAVDLSKIDQIIDELEYTDISRHNLVYYEEEDYCDLLHYAQKSNLPKLEKTINARIIATDYWSNPDNPIPCAYGMTIYYPKSYDSRYDDLLFARESDWDDALKENL